MSIDVLIIFNHRDKSLSLRWWRLSNEKDCKKIRSSRPTWIFRSFRSRDSSRRRFSIQWLKNHLSAVSRNSPSFACHLSSIWSTHVILSARLFSRVHPPAARNRLRSSGSCLSFLPVVFDPGGKSRRFPQAVRDGWFREAISRLLLVWPTARSSFLPSRADSDHSHVARRWRRSARQQARKKNDRPYLLPGYIRDGLLLTVHVSKRCHEY